MWSNHAMEYYAALKILTHATACLNLEDIILNEISQSQKDKYCMIPLYEVLQVQFSQSCLTLCKPMNRSTPGLYVHHQLPESTQTHVHCVSEVMRSLE